MFCINCAFWDFSSSPSFVGSITSCLVPWALHVHTWFCVSVSFNLNSGLPSLQSFRTVGNMSTFLNLIPIGHGLHSFGLPKYLDLELASWGILTDGISTVSTSLLDQSLWTLELKLAWRSREFVIECLQCLFSPSIFSKQGICYWHISKLFSLRNHPAKFKDLYLVQS